MREFIITFSINNGQPFDISAKCESRSHAMAFADGFMAAKEEYGTTTRLISITPN